ncbi:MAG: dihydrofolate reductase family protein [Candidatus Eremiobacteraeota bacterium]|nr:dihydrofolate reductase family protein [Planctomycetaceae bacterium]MBV8655016.1 dihydrofolate reductase family protein [Candidatus Eremiobacteraeota bacterium]
MSDLEPLEMLYETDRGGEALPLPPGLSALYGPLRIPPHPDRPYVVGNFVTSLDGVAALGEPGSAGGGPISGRDPHDRMIMGLLRAVADAVIVGAGTQRAANPRHLWTAECIAPALADTYQALWARLGRPRSPLNVVITARGEIDRDRRLFRSGEVPVLIVTTASGSRRLQELGRPPSVQVAVSEGHDRLGARSIVDAVGNAHPSGVILVEGGPHLLGDFLAEGLLDELFLTLSPQVVGRNGSAARPGLVAGRIFAPEHPLWATPIGVKRGESHLFLRYAFRKAG